MLSGGKSCCSGYSVGHPKPTIILRYLNHIYSIVAEIMKCNNSITNGISNSVYKTAVHWWFKMVCRTD